MKRFVAVSILTVVVVTAFAGPASAKPKAKLKPTAITGTPASAKTGDSFPVAVTIANRGDRNRKARVRVYLRQGEADGTRIAKSERKRIRAGRERDYALTATVDSAVAAGLYDVVGCVKRRGNAGGDRCLSATGKLEIEGADTPPLPPPAFTPGAQTLGDPLLPQLGNGGYDARHYDIELDYDPTGNQFDSATTRMRAIATQDLSAFSLDFQNLPVASVNVSGTAAAFTQVPATPPIAGGNTQPMKLVVTPASGITNGSEFEVEVAYGGQPGSFVDPDGSPEGWLANPTCPVPATCSHWVVGEPMGAQAWFPSNNHPSDKATVTTAITVPAGQVGVGVGEQAVGSPSTAGGRTTWTWEEDDPTSTYLLTASNGNYTTSESDFTEALSGGTYPVFDAVTSGALPNQSTAIAALSDLNEEMVDLLGSHWGPYPFDSYGSVWDNVPSAGYALEVQTKSHFSSLPPGPAPSAGLTSTYLHELAHQWWGNAVTLERWSDLWFNEGWAVLSEWIYDFEANAGDSPEQRFDDAYAGASASSWSTPPATLNGNPALMFSPAFPTYTRGAMTLAGYREIIGAAAFDAFAASLQSEYAHANISTQEFIAEALAASGFSGAQLQLLGDYFQQWLYGMTKPTITPDSF